MWEDPCPSFLTALSEAATFAYRHTRCPPDPPAAVWFWLALVSQLLQAVLGKRLWKKRWIYSLLVFVDRCRKTLYLVSDWFVHLPMKYLVNGKNKWELHIGTGNWDGEKSGASTGEVQYQAVLTKALHESESMAWASCRAFSILIKVFSIEQIDNKTRCRLYCM